MAGDAVAEAMEAIHYAELLTRPNGETCGADGGPVDKMERFCVAHNTQVLTFVFSDIVNFTPLQYELGNERAREILQRHRAVFLKPLNSFDGLEMSGDSIMAVFATPSKGVAFVLTVQANMRLECSQDPDLPEFRVGLDQGEVILGPCDFGPKRTQFFGIAVSRAQRIMDIGRGGQILCSRRVYDDAFANIRKGTLKGVGNLKWHIHGMYQLKGFKNSYEICEVGEEEYAPFARPAGYAEESTQTAGA